MTDLEKLQERLATVDAAFTAVQHAATTERKLSHDKHTSGHFTKALAELDLVRTSLSALIKRHETVGR